MSASGASSQRDLFKDIYYVSFTAFALAGLGYFGWKIYKESLEEQKGRKQDKQEKPKRRRKSSSSEDQIPKRKKQAVVEDSGSEEEQSKRTLKKEKETHAQKIPTISNSLTVTKNPEKELLIKVLIDLKTMCGTEMPIIKKKNRFKRRSAKSKEEYGIILEEMNERVNEMMEENSSIVLKKLNIDKDEFERLLRKYKSKDDEINDLFNTLCVVEM